MHGNRSLLWGMQELCFCTCVITKHVRDHSETLVHARACTPLLSEPVPPTWHPPFLSAVQALLLCVSPSLPRTQPCAMMRWGDD